MNHNELYHWGILGMHWGVRRYQNKDGTLTSAGKKRYGEYETPGKVNKLTRAGRTAKASAKHIIEDDHTKAMLKGTAIVMGVALASTAVVVAARNPRVRSFVGSVGHMAANTASRGFNAAVQKGKTEIEKAVNFVKAAPGNAWSNAKKGVKEGLTEGVKSGTKNIVKAAVGGAIMVGGKKLLDKAVGEDNTAKMFASQNNKKINSYWRAKETDPEDLEKRKKKRGDDDDD